MFPRGAVAPREKLVPILARIAGPVQPRLGMFQHEVSSLDGVIVAGQRLGRMAREGRHQVAALASPKTHVAGPAAMRRALDRAGDDQHRLAEAAVILLVGDAPRLLLLPVLLAKQMRHGVTMSGRNPGTRRRRA